LQAIALYFGQRACKKCAQPYTADGIEFLRQEPGVIVVKVGCTTCGCPLGIALVGMNNLSLPTCTHGRPGQAADERSEYPQDWSKRDIERLQNGPPISYDDILSAHEFFSSLGADWSTKMPKLNRKTGNK
jgi:hypothetical protein